MDMEPAGESESQQVATDVKIEAKDEVQIGECWFPQLEENNASKRNWQLLIRSVVTKHGGPAQFLQNYLCESELVSEFGAYVDAQLLPVHGVEYRAAEHEVFDTAARARLTDFGFDDKASTKPAPFESVVTALASEFDVDGYITQTEPLRSFVREDAAGSFT